jgi:hypothetical protein
MAERNARRETAGRKLLDRAASLDGWRLDAAMTALTLWILAGVVLDVRSHIAGFDFAEEGFLTPEHAMFYSGFLAVAGLVGAVTYGRRRQGRSWSAAVPAGYGAGVLGLFLFGLGGPGDALWHTAFGAEANVEALTSPTHLLLGTGSALYVSSPLRAAWRRPDVRGWRRQFAPLVSATLTLTTLTLFTLYAHPLTHVVATETGETGYGLVGVVFQSALLMGVVLALLRRFTLVPGALTLVIGANGAAMAFLGFNPELVPMALLAGVVADALYVGLDPVIDPGPGSGPGVDGSATSGSGGRPAVFRAFAFGVPAIYYALYFAALGLTEGVAWSLHLWAGAIALAGLAGLLVSYAMVPTTAAAGASPATHPARDAEATGRTRASADGGSPAGEGVGDAGAADAD